MKIDDRLRSKWWRINHLYKIIDKYGELVTFKCNEEQTYLFNKYQDHKASGAEIGLRQQNLKARQIGFTTFHVIYFFDEILFNRNRHARIVAHKQKLLEEIFEKVAIAHKNLPEIFRMKTKSDSAHKLSFEESNSSIAVTLGCRGETVHHLHVAEIAHIQGIKELIAGSFKSVGFMGDITTETTANGVGNYFHNTWQNPRIWSNNFFSWMNHKAYRLDNGDSTGAYDDYLDKLGADEAQRRWWYFQLSELSGDYELMLQENPANPEDAFMSSNRAVFSDYNIKHIEPRHVELITDYKAGMIKDTVTCVMITRDQAENVGMDIEDIPETFELIDAKNSPLSVWEEPVEDVEYVIGGDVAEGLAKGDYSSAHVIRCDTMKVVAKWHGHIAPDLFGEELMTIGRYYNTALIGVEVNNHGLATINAMKADYTHLYYRESFDETANKMSKKLGWLTNMKTKPLMIDDLNRVLRELLLEVHDEKLSNELSTFVYDDNGKMGAVSGCFDDQVISMAIAVQMYIANPSIDTKQRSTQYM